MLACPTQVIMYVYNIHQAWVNIGWYLPSSIWPEAYIATKPIYLLSERRGKYGEVAMKPKAILQGKYPPIFARVMAILHLHRHYFFIVIVRRYVAHTKADFLQVNRQLFSLVCWVMYAAENLKAIDESYKVLVQIPSSVHLSFFLFRQRLTCLFTVKREKICFHSLNKKKWITWKLSGEYFVGKGE